MLYRLWHIGHSTTWNYFMALTDDSRPRCCVDGCNNYAKINNTKKNGNFAYKKRCNAHHQKKYKMGRHRYSAFKKAFCENVDGRLGFICNTVIHHSCMLSVDHINGNNRDDSEENLQTLCLNCHSFKTITEGDHLPKASFRSSIGDSSQHPTTRQYEI